MRRSVVTLAAGAALTVGLSACKPKATATTTPDVEPEPERTSNPPAPSIPEVAEEPEADEVTFDRDPAKPTWDAVASGHPKGATNPPIPELIVTPDGRCFKHWVSGMAFRPGQNGNRVAECGPDDSCGTPIQCPDKAATILAERDNGPK